MNLTKKYGFWVLVLVLISPVGIILPEILNAGDAWGEWSPETLKNMIGYIPEGIKSFPFVWYPVLPDYNAPFNDSNNVALNSFWYIFSGILGTSCCFFSTQFLFEKLYRNK